MTRRRHTPDQIIRKLAEGNTLLAGGTDLDEVCRHLGAVELRRVDEGGGVASYHPEPLRPW